MVSPLLANIVLHYVLDEWFAKEVRPRLKGEAFLVDVHTPKANVQYTTLDRKPLKSVRNRHQTNTILNTSHEPKSTTVLELKYRSYEMFTIIQEFTEKYRGFRGSLFSIHPLSGCERLPFLIRYADDFVIGVAREDDARRIMEVLPKRMSKYGLTVHPEKTRVVRFHPADAADSEPADQNSTGPRTFDFLGFTHYWGRSRGGGWVVKRKTAKGRLKRALAALAAWCRENLHLPIGDQHQKLTQKLEGHYGYYGIIGNYASLQKFLGAARGIWKRWLSRRGRDKPLSWPEFVRLEQHYRLPPARVVHGLLSGAAKS